MQYLQQLSLPRPSTTGPGDFLDAVPIAAERAGEVGGGVPEQRGEVGQL